MLTIQDDYSYRDKFIEIESRRMEILYTTRVNIENISRQIRSVRISYCKKLEELCIAKEKLQG